MMSKKTIKVKEMLDWANHQLSRTDEYATEKFKAGISVMIEKILMDSGNYMGYMGLDSESEYSRVYSTSNKLR
jgi:hypothetical protein